MNEESDDYLVSVDRVTKRFGTRLVLDDVSLAIRPGETVALLGPSGGGKSTLLRCINALNALDAGEIRVGSHRLTPSNGTRADVSTARSVRRLMGMVFQDFQLFPHLTALENIIEGPMYVAGQGRSEATRTAQQLLERVGLGDRGSAYPQQLSGGQKQRVAIARSLAMRPQGLLCDEITSALDPELKHEVLSVLSDLKRDGMTLIMVTHEIGFARRAADRVVVLCDGKIIDDGPPSEVLDHPRSPRTKQFLSNILG
ncbi:MAG TPA: amino acid ABC transporter ATP-binding protein [Pirellulales bacterium]|nr:amino acid ABC transporter ATP-binding protein [Pirellulales bacterium]